MLLVTEDEYLAMTLRQRIAWLRSKDGPRGKLSHDRFADTIGTSRQMVINWENGMEPKKFVKALADFSGFRPEVFSRREAEELVQVSSFRRLLSLEGEVRWLVDQMGTAFSALGLELAPREDGQPPLAADGAP